MANTVQDALTIGDAKEIDLEEAARLTWDEVLGDAYDTRNGLRTLRPAVVSRGFTATSSVVSRNFTNTSSDVSR